MRLQTSNHNNNKDQSFFDRNVGVRVLLGIIAIFAVGSFMHFREPSREILELNKKSNRYVVAQVGFSFFDEELTNQLKQEAARDIGPIFRLDEKEVREQAITFERGLSQQTGWREEVGHTTFEEINKATQNLVNTLTSTRFSDLRTVKEVNSLKVQDPKLYVFVPKSIKKRNALGLDLWHTIGNQAFEGRSLTPETANFILKFFRAKKWKFEEDRKLRDQIRRTAQSRIHDVYTKVYAGERIVDKGELVGSKHIAMLQAMKRAMQKSRNLWHPLTLIGSLMLSSIFILSTFFYLRAYHQKILRSNKQLLLLAMVSISTLFLSKLIEYALISTGELFESVHYPLYVPFCAILISSLINARVAFFSSGVVTLILSITLSVEVENFILLNILASVLAIFGSRALFKRKDIFTICTKAWLGVTVIIVSLFLYNNQPWSLSILTDLLTTFVFMLFTAILVAGLLPVFETVFNVLTNITLMEYMDPNNKLLRRLMIEAPGTYQHSMLVGNLAEAAASSIKANGLFCRVSTLYHDIGKLTNPYYFTENQQGGVNMHQLLTPLESAQVIIGHVRDGVALARKEGLPEQFIDIIKEHHGTTLAQCMYYDQCNLMGGDKSLVDERDFRYGGPKPRSKESAIIMISDVLEAASRTLGEFTDENLTELVETLVQGKAEDGQFDDCSLTFEELGIVKRALVKTLLMAGHSRIKYPYQEQQEQPPQAGEG